MPAFAGMTSVGGAAGRALIRNVDLVAVAKEEQAKVEADRARVVAEQELERERIELQTRRLEADVITPARARKEAMELEARGQAASILEDGNAQIEVFRRLVAQYQEAGNDAERIFVLNMLPELIDKIVGTVAGDDTVLVCLDSKTAQRRVRQRVEELL